MLRVIKVLFFSIIIWFISSDLLCSKKEKLIFNITSAISLLAERSIENDNFHDLVSDKAFAKWNAYL